MKTVPSPAVPPDPSPFLSLIESKRDGRELSPESIAGFVRDFTSGAIPDYQMSAMLMAIYFAGMTPAETRALTLAMRDSGEVLTFPDDPRPIVDKHSTGGVGDKVSLPLAPLLAALDFRVPMISGRGLGITGGTLDKLESIPGFTTQLDPARLVEQVQRIGVAMAGQTDTMIPADKKLYALRDVTGTVPSIPLITASILSKKLAESLNALVMDVKFGAAAFMPAEPEARRLADSIASLAEACGVRTAVLISDMNTPLGRSAGNWLEIQESMECLENKGPEDLRQLVVECAAQLLILTSGARDLADARTRAIDCLASGKPRRKWNELLAAQGADLDAFQRRLRLDHTAAHLVEVPATRDGMVSRCDARVIGEVVRDLGGGRLTKESIIDPAVGIDRLAKPGDVVRPGDILCRIHAATEAGALAAQARVAEAFEVSDLTSDG
ncbi:MAG: pyrimidine-nucleoside phosphorylase [Verrucomicrobiota bacterium]|jgi:pyrimidine-nucleoside phosphorylase